MTPQERFEKFREAAFARANAEAEFEVARALLTFDFGDVDPDRYEVYITHDQIAKIANRSLRQVRRWITDEGLQAEKHGKKWRVPLKEWEKWKASRGL